MMKLSEIFPNEGFKDHQICTMTPHWYQLEDVKKHVEWKGSTNLSEVGLGKSLVAYLWITLKVQRGGRVVVVMSPGLIFQFTKNFGCITGMDMSFGTIAKDKKQRDKDFDLWEDTEYPDMMFMSYQMFIKYHKHLGSFTALVADEAHQMSNASTLAFRAVAFEVFSKSLDFLLMTATPTPTELRNAYAYIKLKSPGAYQSLEQFDRIHVEWSHPSAGPLQVVGYKQEDLIAERLNYHSVRRRAKDVLNLADPSVFDFAMQLSPEHTNLYLKLLNEWFLEFGEQLLIAKNQQALRQLCLQLITCPEHYTKDRIEDVPLDNLKEIQRSLEGNKLAVFCNYRVTVEKLSKVFKDLNPALVYGGSNVPENVEKFLNEPTCKIAILNVASGGAGFNLQSVCSDLVFYEPTGSPGAYTQAIGRVHRQGQTRPVRVWMFQYCGTKSSKLMQKGLERFEGVKNLLFDNNCLMDFMIDMV